MSKIITVFGSSLPKPGEQEYENAYLLGKLLGAKGYGVCSGGYQGIMDAVSKGASEQGQDAIGVTVDRFHSKPSEHLTRQINTDSLIARIETLVEQGSAYVVLPGGTGTLLELSLVWEYMNKGIMRKKPFIVMGKMWEKLSLIVEKRVMMEGREIGLVKPFDYIEETVDYVSMKLG